VTPARAHGRRDRGLRVGADDSNWVWECNGIRKRIPAVPPAQALFRETGLTAARLGVPRSRGRL